MLTASRMAAVKNATCTRARPYANGVHLLRSCRAPKFRHRLGEKHREKQAEYSGRTPEERRTTDTGCHFQWRLAQPGKSINMDSQNPISRIYFRCCRDLQRPPCLRASAINRPMA